MTNTDRPTRQMIDRLHREAVDAAISLAQKLDSATVAAYAMAESALRLQPRHPVRRTEVLGERCGLACHVLALHLGQALQWRTALQGRALHRLLAHFRIFAGSKRLRLPIFTTGSFPSPAHRRTVRHEMRR